MTFFTIFSIVVIILFITAMLAAAYFAIKAVLTGDVSQLVALAEMTTLPGPEKMAQVVASMSARPKSLPCHLDGGTARSYRPGHF